MKYLVILSAAFLLTACKSAAEREQEFLNTCTQTEFTLAQCRVLYSIKESSDSASNNAAAASAMSGFAAGMAAGRK